MTDTKKIVDAAWHALEALCESSQDRESLLHKAITASMAVEKAHRGFAPSGHRHKHTQTTVARYFVLHNLARSPKPGNWAEAALTRADILYSRGLGELLRQDLAPRGKLPDSVRLAADLHYPEDFQ